MHDNLQPEAAPAPPGDAQAAPRGSPPPSRPATWLVAGLALVLLLQLAQSFWSARQRALVVAEAAAVIAEHSHPASADWPTRAAAALAERPDLRSAAPAVTFVATASATQAQVGGPPQPWAPSVSAPVTWRSLPAGTVHVALAWSDWLAPMLLPLALAAAALLLSRRAQRDEQAWRQRLRTLRDAWQSRWLALFDAGGDALVQCDSDGCIVALSARARELLGADAGRAAGRTLSELLTTPPGEGQAEVDTGLKRGSETLPVTLRSLPGQAVAGDGRIWCIADLSEERRIAQRMSDLTHHDALTGLPNRAMLRERLQRAMGRAARSGRSLALMFIDLDQFRDINASLGHTAGDAVLRNVAAVLRDCARSAGALLKLAPEDLTVARPGGDEFTLLVENIGGVDDAALVARRILESLEKPYAAGDTDLVVTASIGIALFPTDDVDLDGLMCHADRAMYRSKSMGRNTFSFFSDELSNAVRARVTLEGSLRHAIERNEFVLHYQPTADLVTGRITGVEALLRWHCPGRGLMPPDRFLAVLEDTGLILPVGAWVIRTALADLEQWDRAGLPPIRVAVNLSARQLRHQFLGSLIEESLAQHRIPAQRLELDLPESLLTQDNEGLREMLAGFARIGLQLAADDFGSGAATPEQLEACAIDTLKIDRSLVGGTPQDEQACAAAAQVVAVGRSLHARLVAEGVESDEQAAFLRQLGCDEIQGYLLTRPLPLPDLIRWYRDREARHRDPGVFGGEPATLPGGLITLADSPVAIQAGLPSSLVS